MFCENLSERLHSFLDITLCKKKGLRRDNEVYMRVKESMLYEAYLTKLLCFNSKRKEKIPASSSLTLIPLFP